jgi:hypothetical protein
LATLRNKALDAEFLKRYPIKYPTSMQRLKASGVSGGSAAKRGRETENSQGTKVSRSNTDNGSQQRPICFHPMASLNNDGCVVDRCSYYHPKFSDRDSC